MKPEALRALPGIETEQGLKKIRQDVFGTVLWVMLSLC